MLKFCGFDKADTCLGLELMLPRLSSLNRIGGLEGRYSSLYDGLEGDVVSLYGGLQGS